MTKLSSVALVLSLALASTCTQAADSGSPRYLSIEDVLGREDSHPRSPLAVSPDGEYLAVAVLSAHEEKIEPDTYMTSDGVSLENLGTTLRLVHLPGGDTTQPFGEGNYAISPAWSPDGRYLAALARNHGVVCVALWERATGRATFYPGFPVRVIFGWEGPVWFPDSQQLICSCARNDPNDSSTAPDEKDFTLVSDPNHKLPPAAARKWPGSLTILNLPTGKVRAWSTETGQNFRISPDGRQIALVEYRQALKDRIGGSYAMVVAAANEASDRHVIAENLTGSWMPVPIWSPDSTKVAFAQSGRWQVANVGVPGEQARMVPTPPPEARVNLSAQPVWRGDNQALCSAGPGGVWTIDLEAGVWRKIADGPAQWLTSCKEPTLAVPCADRSGKILLKTGAKVSRLDLTSGQQSEVCATAPPEGLRIVAANESVVCGGDVWCFDLQSGQQTAVYQKKDPQPAHRLLPQQVKLNWKVGDKPASGIAYLPADYRPGKQLPTIIEIYPGGRSAPINIQPPDFLVAAGFAVFYPDVPLSANNNPMAEIVAGTDAAADAAVAAGWADPERLGVMGHSFGGYGALCVVAGSHRYKAVASLCGIGYLPASYLEGTTGYYETGQGDMGGTYWDRKERYLANSPLDRFPEVSTPLLLAAGSLPSDSAGMRMAFEACNRLGKTAVLYEFTGAQHGPEAWPIHARRQLATVLREWFQRFLDAPPLPGTS